MLSPQSNLGFFATNKYSSMDNEGTHFKSYATGDRLIQDYNSSGYTSVERFDLVYTKKLYDSFTLGGSFNYYYSKYKGDTSFDTISSTVGTRNDDYTQEREKNFFGGTLGIQAYPIDALQLNLSVGAGGFFGTYSYEEDRLNALGTGEFLDYDNDGNYSGWMISTLFDGFYMVSDNLKVPFGIKYTYWYDTEEHDGFGTVTNAGATNTYFKNYDRENSRNRVEIKTGVLYYFENSVSIPIGLKYIYDNRTKEINSFSDYSNIALGTVFRTSNTKYNDHTIATSIGVKIPIKDVLTFSSRVNYSYTFVKTDFDSVTYRNGVYDGSSDISESGYRQNLNLLLGLRFMKTLKSSNILEANLSCVIPIVAESDYYIGAPTLDTTNSAEGIRGTSSGGIYRINFRINYHF